MGRILNIGVSTLLSGGILSHGTLSGYISDAARRALGMGLAHFKEGTVHYLGKDIDLLGRGLIQTVHQAAYGALRSYPRYLKYWEQTVRDKYLQTQSQTSLANKTGQYYRLIEDQQAVARKKNHTDTIVGNVVMDYLELSAAVTETPGGKAGSRVEFVDLGPRVQVSSKNNIVLTTVQGRDHTRKEFVSGGDYEISIEGKITSKYPDVYPEAEVSKFLKLMRHKGIIDCSNTILRQFKITQLIVLSYALGTSDCRNVQPYTLQCVAVEPSEAIEVRTAEQERVDEAIKHTNKWIKWVQMGTDVVDPSSLLKISRLWL
jgi:hypothetical protein